MNVYSLICHRDVDQALTCLGSFQRMALEEHSLHLYDDGSLTKDDEKRLHEGLRLPPNGIIHNFEHHAALQGYPHLAAARERFVMCRKLIDIPLIGNGPILILDTDILLLRPFTGLNVASQQHDFICMRDQQSAYSPNTLSRLRLKLSGQSMISHANAGMLLVDTKLLNLDLLEAFFTNSAHLRHPALVEQTAWAMLGAHATSAAYWEPQSVSFPPANLQASEANIAWHFASDYRHLLKGTATDTSAQNKAMELRTVPASAVTLGEEALRSWKHLKSKFSSAT